MITADGGGSNGSRVRLWKLELQKLADETGLTIAFAIIRPARRSGTRSASPFLSHHAELARASSDQPNGDRRIDRGDYNEDRPHRALRTRRKHKCKGVKISDAEMAALKISGDAFHPE